MPQFRASYCRSRTGAERRAGAHDACGRDATQGAAEASPAVGEPPTGREQLHHADAHRRRRRFPPCRVPDGRHLRDVMVTVIVAAVMPVVVTVAAVTVVAITVVAVTEAAVTVVAYVPDGRHLRYAYLQQRLRTRRVRPGVVVDRDQHRQPVHPVQLPDQLLRLLLDESAVPRHVLRPVLGPAAPRDGRRRRRQSGPRWRFAGHQPSRHVDARRGRSRRLLARASVRRQLMTDGRELS